MKKEILISLSKKNKEERMVSIVYMVAGMSSRFGGRIKQFAKVGPDGETLIEYSVKQALNAGFDEVIFIVGEKTEAPFKEMWGDSYNGVSVRYARQSFSSENRDKPWGTVDAILSAKEFLTKDFVVCNGDDIYGENAFRKIKEYLENSSDSVTIGYPLTGMLPEQGEVTRGMFTVDEKGYATKIVEEFKMSRENFRERGYKEDDLTNVNLFGFHKEIVEHLQKQLDEFKKENEHSRTAECLLPVELFHLISQGKTRLRVYPTNDTWLGVTNPEDEAVVREKIANSHKK